jgi:hypothetical protein
VILHAAGSGPGKTALNNGSMRECGMHRQINGPAER